MSQSPPKSSSTNSTKLPHSKNTKKIQIHYRKHKYTPEKVDSALLFDIQNYIPIYSKFFDLNESNFNQIQLNQKYYIQNIIDNNAHGLHNDDKSNNDTSSREPKQGPTPNYLETTIIDDDGDSKNVAIFVKYSPLIDPIRYLSGKYDSQDNLINRLPHISSNENTCHAKMLDKNNASYIDGFFSYLTSKTLHEHGNVHGIDYYGSYLCKQREFSTNIYDDIDYLLDCDFFHKKEDKLFTLDIPLDTDDDDDDHDGDVNGHDRADAHGDGDDSKKKLTTKHLMNIRKKMRPILGYINPNNELSNLDLNLDVGAVLIHKDEITLEPNDINSIVIEPTTTICSSDLSSLEVSLEIEDSLNDDSNIITNLKPKSVGNLSDNNTDKDNNSDINDSKTTNSNSEYSDSDSESSLSHSSNTTDVSKRDNDIDDENVDDENVDGDSKRTHDEGEPCDAGENDNEDNNSEDSSNEDNNSEGSGDDEDDSYNSDDESYNSDDEKVIAKIKDFPVQAILLEKCVSTLDNIMMNDELTSEEWVSILFQVIMTLLIYQHMFAFTHNDLHTNNVMFIETTEEYVYYLYKEQYYKVPTYGRIFKIIDFGRAIYTFRGQLMCSDSFHLKGDAATQYNFEPYFNPNKPIILPNYSFDLCRFACALFDYFIHDIRKVEKICKEDPVVKLIVSWTMDDKGRNILYKSSGEERYPDFKLYKMIARSVHNHVPSTQINDPLFDQYKITYKKYRKHANLAAKFPKNGKNTHILINVDELPCYRELE